MKKEHTIDLDESDDVEETMDFFRSDDFDVELITKKFESMSGHVVMVKCIKVTRKG